MKRRPHKLSHSLVRYPKFKQTFQHLRLQKNNSKIIFILIVAILLITGVSVGSFLWLIDQSHDQNINETTMLLKTDDAIKTTELERLILPSTIEDIKKDDKNIDAGASGPENSGPTTSEPDSPLNTNSSTDTEDAPRAITDKEQADIYVAQAVEALRADNIEESERLFTEAMSTIDSPEMIVGLSIWKLSFI
jgi:nitrogen fixation-related uncharacterized protein